MGMFVFLVKFQQLQQQQLMKHHRQLMQQSRGLGANNNNNNNKIAGSVDLSPSAWSNQPQRGDVFLGNRTGKRGSTGTGVFLPRCVNHATAEVREKPGKLRRLQFLTVNFFCFLMRNVVYSLDFSACDGFGSG